MERLAPAGHGQRQVVVHEQACRRRPVTCRLVMVDRLDDVAVLLVPGGRAPVERWDRQRRETAQLQAQQIREQVVVAEPAAGSVERGHEGVPVLQPLEDRLGARAAAQRIGQRPADAREDRGAQQQLAYLRWLVLQHLGEEVARHRTLAAGELGHEALRVGVCGQRDRRQPQAGRPSLGAIVERDDSGVRQRDAAGSQHRPGLREREPQLGAAQLHQLARDP